MIQLVELAARLQGLFVELHWEFCFIGGLAVQAWGEVRVTRDVDVSLLTHFSREEDFIDALLARFPARLEAAKDFALANRVLLLRDGDIGIDIGLAGLPFEEIAVQESVLVEYQPGTMLKVISAENLIVMKAFAGRDRDWLDVRGIIVRQGVKLNRKLILERLIPLIELKEEPEALDRLERLFRENT